MKTIHDISMLDKWRGTESCGFAGHEIRHILAKNGFESNFDVEDQYDENDNIIECKYIIRGIPHGSQMERDAMMVIFANLNPLYLRALWEDDDFVRVDRACAEEELRNTYKKIDKYQEIISDGMGFRRELSDIISKHYYFGFITKIRGICIGITPERFYKLPAGEYIKDELGRTSMSSILPEGKYKIFRILNTIDSNLICENEIWTSNDSDLFSVIDKMRGRHVD